MRKIPRAVYRTPEELFPAIERQQTEADKLPPGPEKQKLLIEIAKLRTYAEMKRWVAAPDTRAGP